LTIQNPAPPTFSEEPKAGPSKRPRSKKAKYEDDDSDDEEDDEPITKSKPKMKAAVKRDVGDDDKPRSKAFKQVCVPLRSYPP